MSKAKSEVVNVWVIVCSDKKLLGSFAATFNDLNAELYRIKSFVQFIISILLCISKYF